MPLVLALAALLAGCGGDSDSPPQASQPSTLTTARPAANAVADRRIADRALLRLSDFPTGWEAQDEDDDEDDAELSNCTALKRLRQTRSGTASSPSFAQGSSQQARHNVSLFATADDASSILEEITSSATRRCLAKEFAATIEDSAEDGSKPPDTSTGELRVAPVGAESRAYRITVEYSVSDLNVSAFIDVLAFRRGRGVSLFLLLDVLTPFDEDLGAQLASRADRALRDAFTATS
jgi:hypothetical protein